MATIRVDPEVLKELRRLGTPYIDTPNVVLRRVLKLETKKSESEPVLDIKKKIAPKADRGSVDKKRPAVGYQHPRLCFKAQLIEPLDPHDIFIVVTDKDGIFRFSKQDFYTTFPNVVQSISYQINGYYHYPAIPKKKALPFSLKKSELMYAQYLIEKNREDGNYLTDEEKDRIEKELFGDEIAEWQAQEDERLKIEERNYEKEQDAIKADLLHDEIEAQKVEEDENKEDI